MHRPARLRAPRPTLDWVTTSRPRSFLTAVLAALMVLAPGVVSAHDELIGSLPEDGEDVVAPEEVRLTFSGQIADIGLAVQVTDESGRDVTEGEPVVDGTDVVQALVADLAPGDYEVVWRVTSSDGHPISGDLDFEVEVDEGASGSDDDPSGDDATEDATAEETSSSEPTTDEATDGATDDATSTPTTVGPVNDADAGSGGMPTWAWLAIGLGVLGLGGALALTVSRNRR